MHRLRRDDGIPTWLTSAYRETTALVIESLLGEHDSALQELPESRNLEEFIEPGTFDLVLAAAEALELSLEDLRRLKPYACAMRLVTTVLERQGLLDGADMHFYRRAREEQKAIWQLEDPRTVDALLGSMALELQDEFLARTLRELHLASGRATTMIEAWLEADLTMIETLTKEIPGEVYRRLFVRRNEWWVESIIRGLRESQDALVLVGCGHLAGPDSLLRLLARRDVGFQRVS